MVERVVLSHVTASQEGGGSQPGGQAVNRPGFAWRGSVSASLRGGSEQGARTSHQGVEMVSPARCWQQHEPTAAQMPMQSAVG